jgi:hypothetical protein
MTTNASTISRVYVLHNFSNHTCSVTCLSILLAVHHINKIIISKEITCNLVLINKNCHTEAKHTKFLGQLPSFQKLLAAITMTEFCLPHLPITLNVCNNTGMNTETILT